MARGLSLATLEPATCLPLSQMVASPAFAQTGKLSLLQLLPLPKPTAHLVCERVCVSVPLTGLSLVPLSLFPWDPAFYTNFLSNDSQRAISKMKSGPTTLPQLP